MILSEKNLDDLAKDYGFITKFRIPSIQPEDLLEKHGLNIRNIYYFIETQSREKRKFTHNRNTVISYKDERRQEHIKDKTWLDLWRIFDNLVRESGDLNFSIITGFEGDDEKDFALHTLDKVRPIQDEDDRLRELGKQYGLYSRWSLSVSKDERIDTVEKLLQPHGLKIETLLYEMFGTSAEVDLTRLPKYPVTWFDLWRVIDRLMYKVNLQEDVLRYFYLEGVKDIGYGDFEVEIGS